MDTSELEALATLVADYVKGVRLTHPERREVLHVARGLDAREAARLERVPVDVIRNRRKILYRKLQLSGSSELVSTLLAQALDKLAQRSRAAK